MKGIFVTFEGIEGSGKSTQVRMLVEYLKEHKLDYITTREPGGTPIAESIRTLLLDPGNAEMLPATELLLYCASRAQHTGELILPALAAGKIVICDRYYDSTYAYQGAARRLDEQMIETLTKMATFDTQPDLTVLLDVPVQAGLLRIKDRTLDRLEQEDISFHERVRQHYLSIAKKYSSRFLVLNGLDDPDQIHRQIIQSLTVLIGE
ncbi:MAG TPA: dTMP kinase [Candidatus Cloacimonadota bacterium]|nr:dTMP kinase [Candidatus Cloacimonadota bacterium]